MENKTKKQIRHKWFIVGQVFLVVIIAIALFIFYPRAQIDINGNKVSFNSINANLIIISSNPDFSNPRYVGLNDSSISFNLKPGTYYWKAGNSIIEGFSKEFKIESNVGLEIIEKDGNKELQNVGNVKVNISKTNDGGFVGRIILEPDASEIIEDEGNYVGREDEII